MQKLFLYIVVCNQILHIRSSCGNESDLKIWVKSSKNSELFGYASTTSKHVSLTMWQWHCKLVLIRRKFTILC